MMQHVDMDDWLGYERDALSDEQVNALRRIAVKIDARYPDDPEAAETAFSSATMHMLGWEGWALAERTAAVDRVTGAERERAVIDLVGVEIAASERYA